MALTWVGVSAPVAAVQCNILCTAAPTLAPEITSKQLITSPITGGWMCIVYGVNRDVFSGKVLIINGTVSSISSVVASDPDGNGVSITMPRISAPTVSSRVRKV
jgi:hypothetical protein